MSDAHQVFISYSSTDSALAETVCAYLEEGGVRCWMAPRDVSGGSDWSASIIDAISEAKVFLLILSDRSNHSPQVKREVERATAKGVPVVPFRVEEIELSKHMEYFISTAHWLDATDGEFADHLAKLLATTGRLADAETSAPERKPERPTTGATLDGVAGALHDAGVAGRWNEFEGKLLSVSAPLIRTSLDGKARVPTPWPAIIVAAFVGVIGVFFSVRGILGSISPQILGAEGMGMLVVPALRVTGLLASAATLLLDLLLLAAARRMYTGLADGVSLAHRTGRLLLLVIGLWYVASLGMIIMTGLSGTRGPMISYLTGAALVAALQAVAVIFTARMAGGGAGPGRDA